MTTALVWGKYLLTQTDARGCTTIADGALYYRDGVIQEVGSYGELKERHRGVEELGGPQYLVLPGLVNAYHFHRLNVVVPDFQVDLALLSQIISGGSRPADPYLVTLYAGMQHILNGTTTLMYNLGPSTPERMASKAEAVLKAVRELGLRVAFCILQRNQNRLVYEDDQRFLATLPPPLAEALRLRLAPWYIPDDEYFSYFRELHRLYSGSDRVRVFLTPANVVWCTDAFLLKVKEMALQYGTGIFMNLQETIYQKLYGLRAFGKTPTAHLNDLGFLGPEVCFAHSVWLTEGDIELLAQTGASVSHTPSADLRLQSGIAPVNRLLERGVTVALGTDSFSLNDDDDMFQEMRLALRLHRTPGMATRPPSPCQVLQMATWNGARVTHFQEVIGTLEPGKQADLMLLDMTGITTPYLDPEADIVDALVYRGRADQVDTVVIGGEVVLRHRQFTRLDRQAILEELQRELGQPQPPELEEMRRLAREVLPYIEQFYRSWPLPSNLDPYSKYNSRQ